MIVGLVLAAVVGGCGGSAASVSIEQVGYRAIEQTVMVAGSTNAAQPTQVIPAVSGPVAQVYVEDGQQVAAGQPLVQVDTSNLEQALLSAEASLESTQNLASAFNSLSAGASSISSAFTRVLGGVDAGVQSLFDIEKTLIPVLPENQRMAALQLINNSISQYQAIRQNTPSVSIGGGGGMSNGASEAAADKAISNAQKNLNAATITAPVAGTLVVSSSGGTSMSSLLSTLMSSFSGMIPSGLNLSSLTGLSSSLGSVGLPSGGPLVPGAYVSPGSPIFTIVDLRNMTMVAKVDESDIAKIAPSQTASVTLEAYPGRKFPGTVVKVADTATQNEAGATAFDVTVQLVPVDINLKLGMTGTADVVVATKKAAVAVPVEAVVDKQGKKYVFKVVNGKAKLTPITVGIATDTQVEIVEGVKVGDKVVVSGVDKLKDGQGVKQK